MTDKNIIISLNGVQQETLVDSVLLICMKPRFQILSIVDFVLNKMRSAVKGM